ncbi:hypothetical protein HispidOSU_012489, partial [Sigmodon hispidus]
VLKEVDPEPCCIVAACGTDSVQPPTVLTVLEVQLTSSHGPLHEEISSNYLSYGKSAEKYRWTWM